jgi:hypothetical protein
VKKIILILLMIYGTNAYCAPVFSLTYKYVDENKEIVTGSGTAFPITEHCILTCSHNVMDNKENIYKTITVTNGNETYKCKVVDYDLKYDLAIIYVEETLVPIMMGEYDVKIVNTKLDVVGRLKDGPIKQREGKLVERRISATCMDKIETPFDHGLSGSPVGYNDMVVGIIICGFSDNAGGMKKNEGMFLPISVIKEWLEDTKRKFK